VVDSAADVSREICMMCCIKKLFISMAVISVISENIQGGSHDIHISG